MCQREVAIQRQRPLVELLGDLEIRLENAGPSVVDESLEITTLAACKEKPAILAQSGVLIARGSSRGRMLV